MSSTLKFSAMVGFIALAAACAREEEVIVVEPEPITTEPVYTGKYK